jgi:hypothetical protein
MHIYTPYTYLIGWSQYNKWYYGVRYSKDCHPSDLWINYFTSSKHVKEFREDHGDPDVVQIRKTFNNRKDALDWEEKVLRRLNVSKESKWLNITHNRGFPPISDLSIEVQNRRSKLISESHKCREYPKGRITSKFTKEKISAAQNEIWNSYNPEEYEKRRTKYKQAQENISDDVRNRQAEKRKQTIDSKPDIVCPHCGKTAKAHASSAMSRHHFNNCKEIDQKNIKKTKLISHLKEDISNVKYVRGKQEITTRCYLKTRELKSQRSQVKDIKIYLKRYNITLGKSWYQKSTKWLNEILHILRIYDDKIKNL